MIKSIKITNRGELIIMLLEELKTFVAVIEKKNFTRAGESLNISQPTVSLHIKHLEDELKASLLVRANKTFHITPAGVVLYERAIQLLHLAEQTKEEILWQHNEVSGILRIAASYTIGESVLPEILTRLHYKYPDLHVEVAIANTEDVEIAVREFRSDIGCIEGSVQTKGLIIQPFMEDELILVAASGHPLTNIRHPKGADLQTSHWVMREVGSGTREYTDYLLQSIGNVKPSKTVIGSNEGVKKAILCGLGIAAVSIHTVKAELDSGKLVQLKVDVPLQKRIFSTLYSPLMAAKKHVTVFLEELRSK
ncbi:MULTISPECIES: LysR family transcriptional regulator [Sporosarcina]|uniref:LysR family transcriptional regulator n=2 Tax=Sporosarcina TaxID=1569 RepID=UPI0009ED4F25|nr:LysR substrate-binding domain-containing protein [Sporosarcina psychrophila]